MDRKVLIALLMIVPFVTLIFRLYWLEDKIKPATAVVFDVAPFFCAVLLSRVSNLAISAMMLLYVGWAAILLFR